MKNRIFLLLSAVILMGAPCAQEDHDDHHECPPAATPDAGDLQTLCQEQFPAPDAGACPECDDCSEAPTVGVDEPGMLHNILLGHLVTWAETSDVKAGDPDTAKIDAIFSETRRMACARKLGDCDTITGQLAQMADAYKGAHALRVEGQPLSNIFLSVESIRAQGDEAPPEWAVDALRNLEQEVTAGDKTAEQIHAVIAQIGIGVGKYNGGNLGRILRSVGKDSLNYWESMASDNNWEDQIHRHWLMTDIGFAASGIGIGWAGAASAADYLLDRYW